MGSVVQIIKAFGDKKGFEKAVHELQDALYLESA
jgi:type I restriction enzyme R subunit